jgi:hypothetical protein
MEINSEPLMGFITLMNDPEVTNNLIINNGIERQIIVDGQTYNLECIVEIPLDKNMIGGVITRIINNTFIPFVYQIIGELMIAGEDVTKKTNNLSNAIEAYLNAVGGGVKIKVNRNTQRMCLNIYTAPGVQSAHLSLWINNPKNFQAQYQPPFPSRGLPENYIPGCAHYKLDIRGAGGGPGGNPAETVGFLWHINLDETASHPMWYFSCTAVPNPYNGRLMVSPFTQAVLDGLNECLRTTPVVFPSSIAANVRNTLDPMISEAERRRAAAAASGPPKPGGGKLLRKKTKKTRKTRRTKKSKKTRKQ